MHFGSPSQRVNLIGSLALAMGCLLSDVAAADSGWDVVRSTPPSTGWDLDMSTHPVDTSWDVEPTPTTVNEDSWDADVRPPALPPEAWDVDAPAPAPASATPTWEMPQEPARPVIRGDYDSFAVVSGGLHEPAWALRLTLAGYRETIGLSAAWVKPEYFELELGYFSDLFARWSLVIPSEEEDEPPTIVPQKGTGHGFYGRASISYPMFNQRGLRDRAWVMNAIVGLESRGLVIERDFALFIALAGGVDAQIWHRPKFGWSMGAFVTLPMWELTSGQSLSLRPILRVYAGIVF